ncbi:hypothetical protein [Geodermatophilus maliterrae]|uniref:Tryptophan-associated transmembrane protein (Trp_oprn_chp) n=1 Tax=Geodermatophilus maliterrae TaxID=3162531 RepID=A0ABV3XI59_9ACTN
MPSSPPRRTTTRRSPRAAAPPSGVRRAAPPVAPGRPLTAPFAAVFGVLLTAEDVFLAWLVESPEPGWTWDRLVSGVLALAVVALAGAVLVFLGRGRGWLVLALAAAVTALLLLGATVLFAAALGSGELTGWALLLLPGPLGALGLSVRRPIRDWTRPGRGNRPAPPAAHGRGRTRGR